jgi:1,4-alpha-glucan branching enzyme
MASPTFTSPAVAFSGMGAIPQSGGVLYRVWAPFASSVTLWGDFFNASNLNPISWDSVPLSRDAASGDGKNYWSAFVPGALSDSLYKFQIGCDGTTANTHAQQLYKHDPYARDAVSFASNDVVVDRGFDWTGDNFQMPGWNELVIYEMHVGTFNKQNGVSGTFANAIDKLDYLKNLGINAIELMPAFDFDTTTSMGYNTGLPFAMDNAYGTIATLKSFIKAAHQRGIAVFLDVVYNHFGPQGLDECLSRIDGFWINDTHGEYFYDDVRIWTGYGDNRPDFGRSEVRWYIQNHAQTCLQEFRADGLRLDSTINIREAIGNPGDNGPLPDGWSLLRWIGEQKRAIQGWKILIAEDLQNNSSITRDALFGGMGLDAQWDSTYRDLLRSNTILGGTDAGRSPTAIANAVSNAYSDQGFFQRIAYAESHDEAKSQRIPDLAQPGTSDGWYARKLTTLAAAIMFTTPAIPMIFMGQEFLEWQPWSDSTSPLDWSRTTSCGGILALYTRLIQLRRNWDNNTRGLRGSNLHVFHVNEAAGIVTFHRWDQGGAGDDVVVVANMKGQPFGSYNIGFPRSGTWYLRFNSDWSGYWSDYSNYGYDTTANSGSNQGMPNNGNIAIGPYSALIYSQ